MSAKEAFIRDVKDGKSVTEAAADHGIARSCGYKWWARYSEFGEVGLEERSRRPENSPRRTSQEIVDQLLELKAEYGYGPAKLAVMINKAAGKNVIAASTAGVILDGLGQVKKRRSWRSSPGEVERGPYQIAGAGDSMTADYKGQFRTRDGRLCWPLTIADPFSRFVLCIEALGSTHTEPAKAAFERVFRTYGVPRQIISDNGIPFASANSLGGLTQLSRWWIELGATPVRIMPGRPDQNGIHERMHRTLKAWIKKHLAPDLKASQRSFDRFRHEFNYIRPHEALGQKPPDSAFKNYRPYPKRLSIEYDHRQMEVRKVNANGEIKWNGRLIFVTEVLIDAYIGLSQIDDQLWRIYFGHVPIGYLDLKTNRSLNRDPRKN